MHLSKHLILLKIDINSRYVRIFTSGILTFILHVFDSAKIYGTSQTLPRIRIYCSEYTNMPYKISKNNIGSPMLGQTGIFIN